MLLPSRKPHPKPFGLRAALRDARDTYRRYSGADTAEPPDTAAPPATVEPPLPAPAELAPERSARRDDPDVVLDIPKLHVDEIDLKLDELNARVALEAQVLDLLRLDVGVGAELRGVGLQIKGVDAEALLKVRLENLTVILDRVMNTIDRNPKLLENLAERLGSTLDQVGSGAGRALGEIGEGAGAAVDEVGGIARALAPNAANGNGASPQ
jgi:hypothetical protein